MRNKILLKALAWFFPNRCLLCGEHIDALSFICDSCKPIEVCESHFNISYRGTQKILHVYSASLYADSYAEFIKRFKFNGKTAYARKFAGLSKETMGDFPFENYDAIAYVPMTKEKVMERGYNQAKLFALEFSQLVSLPVVDCLLKVKSNKVQHRLSPEQRAKNVKGVYDCIGDIKGQNIILIDDIITTGATICQCTKMLYSKGANNVTAICIAETPPNK